MSLNQIFYFFLFENLLLKLYIKLKAIHSVPISKKGYTPIPPDEGSLYILAFLILITCPFILASAFTSFSLSIRAILSLKWNNISFPLTVYPFGASVS